MSVNVKRGREEGRVCLGQVGREVNTVAVSLVAMTALLPPQGLWLCECVWGKGLVCMCVCVLGGIIDHTLFCSTDMTEFKYCLVAEQSKVESTTKSYWQFYYGARGILVYDVIVTHTGGNQAICFA